MSTTNRKYGKLLSVKGPWLECHSSPPPITSILAKNINFIPNLNLEMWLTVGCKLKQGA
jgi:hypothetical protein